MTEGDNGDDSMGTRDEEDDWDSFIGRAVKEAIASGVEEVVREAGVPCSVVDTGVDGALGVAAGQRRRSANADRDLRSCVKMFIKTKTLLD